MKVYLEWVFFYLFVGTLLVAIGFGDAFTCPEHCSCSEVQRKRYNYNHAKCTSLDGLRQLGKTSELHSLDLSMMNLTKINNQLDKLTNLSKLDLSGNHISDLSNLHQRRIRFLNMSGNRITTGKLIKIPTTVKHLNLSHNDITILPDSFKRFVYLKSLELADNPLNCTCETLNVRNWLQEQQVWTEKPIKCMAPLQFKGHSWLQIRQSEVCDRNELETPRMLPLEDIDDENDLMLDDNLNSVNQIIEQREEGIDLEYIPVNRQRIKRTDSELPVITENDDEFDDFGSGSAEHDEFDANNDEQKDATDVYEEGSGDDHEENNKMSLNEDDNAADTENASIETTNQTEKQNAEIIQTDANTEREKSTIIQNEDVQESKSTYILLAILGVLLLVLILYVATKRNHTGIKNRRNNNDIESPAQEMKSMDKNNLGKPIQSPGEFIPLIPEKHDAEMKLCQEQPLLKKLTEVENENDHNCENKEMKANDNISSPTQQLNGNAKPVQNDVHADKNNDNDQAHFQPISPKPSRYSPVYSHDTGRVKIKLSETSRPKTPILVNRSRSNASNNQFENTISQ